MDIIGIGTILNRIPNRKKIKRKMSRYFEISGYWKDSKEPFEGLVVKETDDIDDNDDFIFEYGWSESDLKGALNETEGALDFVITNYKEVN